MWSNKKFPEIKQLEQMDCGPTCLQIICKYYGVDFSLEYLRNICETNRVGSNLLSLHEAAKIIQLKPTGIKIGIDDLSEDILPCIAYWAQNHFVVIYKIEKEQIFISDPAIGLISYSKNEFLNYWSTDGENGILLVLETTNAFFAQKNDSIMAIKRATKELIVSNFVKHKKQFSFSVIALIVAAATQFAFPIITQKLVDNGIVAKNISALWVLLFAQFAFFIGKTIAEVWNNFILLKVGNTINLNLITSFFDKLFKLPIQYFNIKRSGDILQRINDHYRVQQFITNNLVHIFITLITILVFSVILILYKPIVFFVFFAFTLAYVFWFQYFTKQRAILDYKNFSKLSERQDKNLEIILGMCELKLHNAGTKKKQEWTEIQSKIFELNQQSLVINQFQFTGAKVISEIKNILIAFFTAFLVIQNQLSFGEMLAITYIVGQLNVPIQDILHYLQQQQDANLSFNRIQEVHQLTDENNTIIHSNLKPGTIQLEFVSFSFGKYEHQNYVLKKLTFPICLNNVTAIVGSSGCGKSTLLKLLLQYYPNYDGKIWVDGVDFKEINCDQWRNLCSVVMQESYLFNDTILNNICIADENVNLNKLNEVIELVELGETIKKFPMGIYTKIGSNGMQISGGEKQRIVLARALYKNSPYLFLDEATSNLDAVTENKIIKNLEQYYINKTVVIVAHRLSTIKNANQIIVMHQGSIIEIGTHNELLKRNGHYANLVNNQMEVLS